MLDAFYIAAIGLQAQKAQLDAMAGNLANIGTPAFKRQSVDFSAILDRAPVVGQGTGAVRSGTDVSNRLLRFDMKSGDVRATGRALDIAIAGTGFFEVELPGEATGYSRAGSLRINADGALSLASGYPLKADIRIPIDASAVRILPDGSVIATLSADREPTTLGQIELALFANPELLQYRGEGVFTALDSDEPRRARPGEEGAGELAVNSLEGSNVNMTDEMVSLMLMQRIYELNSRIAQAADEMIGMSNNMRRS